VRSRTPQHEIHPAPAPQLAGLAFLVGRLHGEGWLGDRGYRYTKQVSGRWVAEGHHLLLEMDAEYPLRGGASDRHSVLVIVSAGPEAGSLISRAFTDGGGMIEYRPTATDEGVAFDDRVPHGCDAERARKVLRATSAGYEETLEIDRGDGALVPWARIELQREDP